MDSRHFTILLDDKTQLGIMIFANNDADFPKEQTGDAMCQLIEGKSYTFKLDNTDYHLNDQIDNIVENVPEHTSSSGIIRTSINVGSYKDDIIRTCDNIKVGEVKMEIHSSKMDYMKDYSTMLEQIASQCAELLMQQSSPVTQRYTVNEQTPAQFDYERFAFVKSLVDSDTLEDALRMVESNPIRKWEQTQELTNIGQVKHLHSNDIRQLASSTRRTTIPDGHFLHNYMSSVPDKIWTSSKQDTLDVAENRFVKFVLQSFLSFVTSIRKMPEAGERLKSEADETSMKLSGLLSHSFFKRLGNLTSLPLNSPAMQRKEGYREILQKWFMFRLAANLSWPGGEDIYEAGQKNIAALYEYWVFFKLHDIFTDKFSLESVGENKLIQVTENGLGISIKQGKSMTYNGYIDKKGRRLNVRFYYNRTFGHNESYDSAGSWTSSMRPDYTLSFWPEGLEVDEAEARDTITHIHFDAKYKVKNYLVEMLDGKSDYEDVDLKTDEGIYKRSDLLKMHAYKDAIRRTAGAYILYPGTREAAYTGFHEIIPGLGAFPLSPQHFEANVASFIRFIDEVIDNFLDRTSQRERIQYHTYEDLQLESEGLYANMPEPVTREKRHPLPAEVYVLPGYIQRAKAKWIKENQMYPFRVGMSKGTLHLDNKLLSVKYILLYGRQNISLVEVDAPLLITKEELMKKGYPSPRHDSYLLYKYHISSNYSGIKWNYDALVDIFKYGENATPNTLAEMIKAFARE